MIACNLYGFTSPDRLHGSMEKGFCLNNAQMLVCPDRIQLYIPQIPFV